MELLEYHFIRTESDNKITLFLRIDKSLLEKDLDIQLNNEKQLQIEIISDNKKLKTNKLADILYENLAYENTLVIFCDEEANFISEAILEPLL